MQSKASLSILLPIPHSSFILSFFPHSVLLPPPAESTVEMPSVPAARRLWRCYWLKMASVDAHAGHMTSSLSLADRCSTYRHATGRGFAFPLLYFLLLLYKMIESWKLYLQKCHLDLDLTCFCKTAHKTLLSLFFFFLFKGKSQKQ